MTQYEVVKWVTGGRHPNFVGISKEGPPKTASKMG